MPQCEFNRFSNLSKYNSRGQHVLIQRAAITVLAVKLGVVMVTHALISTNVAQDSMIALRLLIVRIPKGVSVVAVGVDIEEVEG